MARQRSLGLCGSRLPVDPRRFELLDFHGSAGYWWRSLLFFLSCFLVHAHHDSHRDRGRREFWDDQFHRPYRGLYWTLRCRLAQRPDRRAHCRASSDRSLLPLRGAPPPPAHESASPVLSTPPTFLPLPSTATPPSF